MVSNRACHSLLFFSDPIRPQMSQHLPRSNDTNIALKQEQSSNPCLDIKYGSGIKACNAFIFKRKLIEGKLQC